MCLEFLLLCLSEKQMVFARWFFDPDISLDIVSIYTMKQTYHSLYSLTLFVLGGQICPRLLVFLMQLLNENFFYFDTP